LTGRHTGRKGAAIGAAVLAALTIGACGGDDGDETSASDAGPADALVSCLQDAGYDATVDDAIPGVEAEHTNVVMPLGDLDQGAEFAVFATGADAKANDEDASALIGVSPTELTGNVVWGFDAAADETPDDQAAVEGCLSA
jgi:hypothetical protein